MATMILVTHGSKGDVLPFIKLARTLRERGHRVRFLTHAVFADAARDTGVEFVPIDTVEQYRRQQQDEEAFLVGQLRGLEPESVLAFYRRNRLYETVRGEVELIGEHRDDPDAVVVARHSSGLSALTARELYGLPAAWVSPTPSMLMSMPAAVVTHREILAELLQEQLRAPLGLPPVTDWAGWLDSADLQLGMWPRWFDRAGTPAPSGVHPVGFMLDDGAESGGLPDGLDALLDRDPAPILISGSSGGLSRDVFKTFALSAAAKVGRGAIVVGGRREDLPANAAWYPSLPFADVVPRVGAIIHHGGIGTVARALSSGTPQLILAYNFDRPDNGRRLQARSLARWLPPKLWTEDAITAALEAILATDPVPNRYRPDFSASAAAAAARIESLIGTSRPYVPEPAAAVI